MNIFRLGGDMLHLLSIFLLLLKIFTARSCRGLFVCLFVFFSSNVSSSGRCVFEDSNSLHARVLDALCGLILQLLLTLQLSDEGYLHCDFGCCGCAHEVQNALL